MSIPSVPAAVEREMKVDRIGRNLLFSTAHVTADIAPGLVRNGTSFFYNAMTGERPGVALPVLLTNKHVLEGSSQVKVRFLLANGNVPRLGESIEVGFSTADWVGHPDPDVDIAALSIGGVLTHLGSNGTHVFVRAVDRSLLPSDDVIDDLDVIEPVTFIGYPNSLYDTKNLTPIVRQGTTATPVQLDYCGKPQFLIDASIFPGSSGSPVFIINQTGFMQNGSFIMGQSRLIFMGIVAAVHHQAGTGRILTSTVPSVEFDQMIDLGLVFKWSAVEETIDELCRQRGINRANPQIA